MSAVTRVLCIDDNSDLLAALQWLIGSSNDLACVGCLTSTGELASEVERLKPDVLVLDLCIPGENSLAALRRLTSENAGLKAIVFSGYDDADARNSALDAGAARCVSKDLDGDGLLTAIRDVARVVA